MKNRVLTIMILKLIILIPASLFALLPLIWTLSTSLQPDTGIPVYSFIPEPEKVTFQNYFDAWNFPKLFDGKTTLGKMFLNSVIISIVNTITSLFFDSMAGYVLARKNFYGRNLIFWFVLATLMIPFYTIAIPMYLITMKMGLLNNLLSLILPFMTSGFGIFLFRQAFFNIPLELEEAAKVDGAGEFYIYYRIMIPLVLPTIATMAIFKVLWSWNLFFWPLLVIQDYAKMPINLGLTVFRGQNITRWGLLCAGMSISMIPVMAVFLSLQKYYLKGLTGGAVKG